MPSVRPEGTEGPNPVRILTVCLGNICRSPTAEAAIVDAARQASVAVAVDSAGTSSYHVGESPDRRMVAAARKVGLRLRGRGRKVAEDDFRQFDLIVAMDAANEERLRSLAPPDATAEIARFRSFDPDGGVHSDVPDPYFGGTQGFDVVVDICRRTAAGLVDAIASGEVRPDNWDN